LRPDIEIKQTFLYLHQEEVQELAEKEWQESGHLELPMNINWEVLLDMEESGVAKFYAAFKDGLIIGYVLVLVTESLVMMGTKLGHIEAIYVTKDNRKSRVARDLISFTEKCLKGLGVERVIANSSAKNPIDRFLKMLHYQILETKYDKVI